MKRRRLPGGFRTGYCRSRAPVIPVAEWCSAWQVAAMDCLDAEKDGGCVNTKPGNGGEAYGL
ncbi:MAG: hypothetical protein ABW019_05490 [Chitinophagaceae bacterium]